jgi:hypothetical protein
MLDQRRQEVLGGLIDPMQVLDGEHQRVVLTAVEIELPECGESPRFDHLGLEESQPIGPRRHPEQQKEIWHPLLGGHSDRLQGQAHLLGDRLGAVGVPNPTLRA